MLSKCANPACSARFRYLRQGRIFSLEIKTLSSGRRGQYSSKMEHFWLCESCAEAMEIVWESGRVSTRALHRRVRGRKSKREPGNQGKAAAAIIASL
jgi:hypothetical protein